MIIWSPGWSVQLATGGVKTHDQVPVKKSRSRLPFTIDCSCSCKLPLLLEILLSLAFSRDVCKAEREIDVPEGAARNAWHMADSLNACRRNEMSESIAQAPQAALATPSLQRPISF